MSVALEPVSRLLRVTRVLLPWGVLALLFFAAPRAPDADGRYGSDRVQPVAIAADEREASRWDLYVWVGAGIVALLEALLIAGLLVERIDRRRGEG